MNRSRGRRVTARVAVAAALVATTAVVASVLTSGGGRVVQAAGEVVGAGGEYHPIAPQRILDTRNPTLDVAPGGRKPMTSPNASVTFDVPVIGRGGLPAATDANGDCADDRVLMVAVNITVVHPSHGGYLRAFGKGAAEGGSSLINFRPGDVVPNNALLRPGCDGALTIRMYSGSDGAAADVLIDVFGFFSTSAYPDRGARLETAGPARIYDSRLPAFGAAPFSAQEQFRIQIRGVDGVNPVIPDVVPNSPNITAVLVNLTATNGNRGSVPTFVSLLPQPLAPGAFPSTSNLNLRVGQVRSNLAIVPLDADGGIWVYNLAGATHVILDVMGYLETGRAESTQRGRVIPLVSPFRAFDTRDELHGNQPLPPASAEDWSFTDFVNDVAVDGTPVGPQLGLVGNLTAAGLERQYSWAPAASYITAYPTPLAGASQTPPLISNLGMVEGEIVPNMVVLAYGTNGVDPYQLRFYNLAGYLDYLLDVTAVILKD